MSRPNINLSVQGPCSLNDNGVSSTISGFAFSHVETTSGTSRRKPTGWIPPTSYSSVMTHISGHKGTYDYGEKSSGFFRNYNGYCDVGATVQNECNNVVTLTDLLSESSGLGNSSLITALSNLKGKKVDLGVAWAERKLTASLIADTATRIGGAYVSLLHGKPRQAMLALGISKKRREPRSSNAAGKWLELQYGWKPLLSDVYGSAEALAKQPPSNWRVTAKGTKSSKRTWEYKRNLKTWPSPDSRGTCTANFGAFTRIDALPANEALVSLSSVGVTNPLLVGWELVPFSFVVDWFYPVGNWLNTLDAMLGYTDIWTSTSVRIKANWSTSGVGFTLPNTRYVNAGYSGSKRYSSLTRSVQSGLVIPHVPRVKNPLSLQHMSNALALLGQAFGRHR